MGGGGRCCGRVRKGWEWVYDELRLRYLIPFFLLFGYTALGALVYNLTLDALDWYNEETGLEASIRTRLGPELWSWWGAMFFCGTIYSTIGYGQPSPLTPLGRLFTCAYALVGIPLFLVILKEVGIHLSRLLRRSWKHGSRSLERLRAKMGYPKPLPDPEKAEKKMSEKKSRLPFPWYFPLLLVVTWICLCGWLFSLWEPDWGFLTSTYFVFMSLSTIGLGDVVPSKPDLMLANFFLLLIGLALISMSFSVIQIRIEELLEDMLQKFIEDFERIGDGKFECGLMEENGRKTSMRNWMTEKIVASLAPRRSPTVSEEGESSRDNADIQDAIEKWASEHGTSGVLLSRMLKPQQLARAEAAVVSKVTAVAQTTGDFSDILHFLDIPHHRKPSRLAPLVDCESQTDVSFESEARLPGGSLYSIPASLSLPSEPFAETRSCSKSLSSSPFPVNHVPISARLNGKRRGRQLSLDSDSESTLVYIDQRGTAVEEFRNLLGQIRVPHSP